MSTSPHHPGHLPLRGLDPARMLGVFENPRETPPEIPGWCVVGIAGRGGFGTVWRARRLSDGSLAAIKIATAKDDPDTLERIARETGSLHTLSHPHIVSLLDAGPLEENGGWFLAMRFIEGADLAQEIPPHGLPAHRACQLFRQIASAVAHAHDSGILHRDLKPGNILLDSRGRAHVADFGLALPIHCRIHQLSLTRAGMIAGTAEYLPPEAYRPGYQPGPATDLFALGVILHEMLTGSPPRGAWKPASSRPGVDLRFDALLARAMDPDPNQRWPDARSMLTELERILASPPRLAGSPLVTRPIRAMDALWTSLGLAMSASGLASFLKLRKFEIKLPFDLVGDLSPILGAFHTLFWLSLPALLLGTWQFVRILRFRHCPIREALPSPFGLTLEPSRTSATLISLTQLFCLVLPAILMFGFFLDSCLVWLKPDDPPWIHGLAVTRWGDGSLLSPWELRPNDSSWLTERFGPVGHPLSQEIGRLGFFPFWAPALMTTAGFAMLAAFLATLLAASRSWLHRRKTLQTASLLLAACCLSFSGKIIHDRDLARIHSEKHASTASSPHTRGTLLAPVHHLALRTLHQTLGQPFQSSVSIDESLYAENVHFRNFGKIPRTQIPHLRAQFPRPAAAPQIFLGLHSEAHWNASGGRFSVRERCLNALADPSGAFMKMRETTVTLEGTLHFDHPIEIDRETISHKPRYRCEIATATITDAHHWIDRFKRSLETNHATDWADCFPPPGTIDEAETTIHGPPGWTFRPPPLDHPWLAGLRQELAHMPELHVASLQPQPGARTRIHIPLRNESRTLRREWIADLIRINGSWRCVRLSF